MVYDVKAGTIGFQTEGNPSPAIAAVKKKQGRVAIAI
jgi:hypothetical protein